MKRHDSDDGVAVPLGSRTAPKHAATDANMWQIALSTWPHVKTGRYPTNRRRTFPLSLGVSLLPLTAGLRLCVFGILICSLLLNNR